MDERLDSLSVRGVCTEETSGFPSSCTDPLNPEGKESEEFIFSLMAMPLFYANGMSESVLLRLYSPDSPRFFPSSGLSCYIR
jgi:hypothetical protein